VDPIVSLLSIVVQLGTVTLIAAFYVVLQRNVRLEEARYWAGAWISDTVALAAILAASRLPVGTPAQTALLGIYATFKTLFAILLLAGTRYHQLTPPVPDPAVRSTVVPAIAWGAIVTLLSGGFLGVQLAEFTMVGALLTWGGFGLLRRPVGVRSRWLGWTILAEGLVFVHHAVVVALTVWSNRPLPSFMSFSSFIDTAVELLIALAALVALHERTAEELRWANRTLVETQERLRELVDRDPLTDLCNRRRLGRESRRIQEAGAAVAFLDLDGFKKINDRYGHIQGDACLRRAARVLLESFREEDLVLRWGGDEFLVIAPGLSETAIRSRLERVRRRLAEGRPGHPSLDFSAGITYLEPGGSLRAAIAEADRLMYASKSGTGGPAAENPERTPSILP